MKKKQPLKKRIQTNRPATERMLRIHQLINDGKYPNAATMATEFAVTQKTLARDIEYMRDHFELPIAYDRQRHGFFYSKPVDAFPGASNVTEAEMFALLVAHKAIAQYHGTPFHQPLQMAFQKLTGQLDRKDRYSLENFQEALSFRPLAPEDSDMEVFKTVTRALRERRGLQFEYRKPGEKASHLRCVHPYHMTCSDNRWYILAHDTDRADVRTFALGRLTNPKITDEKFTKPHSFDPQKYLKGSFTVMSGSADYEVVIEFDAWATDQLRGRHWHATQTVTELPDGSSQMQMRLSGLEEIQRWILSWGTHANVLRPAPLAEQILQIADALAHRYAAT